jgi:hypothetical protein
MWSGQGQNLPRGGERVSGEADGFGPILATHINSASAAPAARKVQRGFRRFPFPQM